MKGQGIHDTVGIDNAMSAWLVQLASNPVRKAGIALPYFWAVAA